MYRANRVCLACNSGAIGDEMHMVCIWQQHADLFTSRTDTMRSFQKTLFFAQQDHLGVLNYVIDYLSLMHIRHHCHDWHK